MCSIPYAYIHKEIEIEVYIYCVYRISTTDAACINDILFHLICLSVFRVKWAILFWPTFHSTANGSKLYESVSCSLCWSSLSECVCACLMFQFDFIFGCIRILFVALANRNENKRKWRKWMSSEEIRFCFRSEQF